MNKAVPLPCLVAVFSTLTHIMMKRAGMVWLVAVITGILSMADARPATAAAAANTQVETIPIDHFIATNTCNGENVDLSGVLRVETHVTINADGTFILDQNGRTTGEGTGVTSGAAYTFSDNFHLYVKASDPLPFTLRSRETVTLKGEGVPDQIVHLVTVIVIDPDGNVKTAIETATVDCN